MKNADALEVVGCTRCPALVESRSQIVNGAGASDADLLLVGEGPGATEDERGEPFVGRSGTVLTEALARNGISRSDVRITNCVRCRPQGNRDPTRAELDACRPYLDRGVALVDPALVVTLGKVPSEHLLGRAVAVTAEAGRTVTCDVGGRPRDVLVCVHPAATLYDPGQRDAFESAIERAATVVGAGGQSHIDEF